MSESSMESIYIASPSSVGKLVVNKAVPLDIIRDKTKICKTLIAHCFRCMFTRDIVAIVIAKSYKF